MSAWLNPDEIRTLALDDRKARARRETFTVTPGEMIKGEHLLETATGKQYTVTLHHPESGTGHCNCPDYQTNRLGTCKHIMHLVDHLKKKRGFAQRVKKERFPFIDIYWDSVIRPSPTVQGVVKNGRQGAGRSTGRLLFTGRSFPEKRAVGPAPAGGDLEGGEARPHS
jgi:hypothetical protein